MKKILIAEDDPFVSNAYRVKLTKEGFETKMVKDGNELLKQLENYIPDLVILDLVMPNKDGFETLKELKKNQTWKNIPIIIASNLGQNEDIEQGMRLGANDYIVKTELSLKDLITKIKTLAK